MRGQRGRMTLNKSRPRSVDAIRLKVPPLHVAMQASLKGCLSKSVLQYLSVTPDTAESYMNLN